MKFPTDVYFGFFCIWKITEFMPTCLRDASFFETQCSIGMLAVSSFFHFVTMHAFHRQMDRQNSEFQDVCMSIIWQKKTYNGDGWIQMTDIHI